MESYLGQIRMFGFGFNPRGYALCNGATMQISQYTALYSLIGIQFGGDGRNTFMLPDLRGRVPLGADPTQSVYIQGKTGGAEMVQLGVGSMPAHSHSMNVSATPAAVALPGPANRLAEPPIWSNGNPIALYGARSAPAVLAGDSIGTAGTGASHNNMQPFQVLNFCIALSGYYPSRN